MKSDTLDKRNWTIGLFDSGIGGLSILKELLPLFPKAQFHYIADRRYAPYGKLSSDEVFARAQWCTQELFLKRQCQLVVVACNTATAAAIDHLREDFKKQNIDLPLVGVEPYLNVLNKEKKSIGDHETIIALTTPLLAKTNRFMQLKEKSDVDSRIRVHVLDQLAMLVEEWFEGQSDAIMEEKVRKELAPVLKYSPKHVILGCTHYPLVKKTIAKILSANTIDPSPYVAQRVVQLLQERRCVDSSAFSIPEAEFAFHDTSLGVWENKQKTILLAWPK